MTNMKRIISSKRHQKGFTLIELGVGVVVLSTMLVAITLAMNIYFKRMQVQIVGQQYQIVNAAVGKYLKQYASDLKDINDICSTFSMAFKEGRTESNTISGSIFCKRSFANPYKKPATAIVNNVFQPTIHELRELGFIENSTINELQLQTNGIVYMPNSNKILAPRELVVLITKTCAPSGCPNGAKFDSLVFNAQPFSTGNNMARFNFDLEDELLVAAGPDAAIAKPGIPATSSFELKGELFSARNPIRDFTNASASLGIRGIMAVRNSLDLIGGYTGESDYARRDGTSTMTGDWEFSNHDVTEVNWFDANVVYGKTVTGTNFLLPRVIWRSACNPSIANLAIDQNGYVVNCLQFGTTSEGRPNWLWYNAMTPPS